MPTICIIGAGNVAYHFTTAFVNHDINVIQIYNRTLQNAQQIANKYGLAFTDKLDNLLPADIYIISTNDKSIESISEKLDCTGALVLHTSGSISIDALKKHKRRGVLYPLQTFSKNRPLQYHEIPFYIETSLKTDEILLRNMIKPISEHIHYLDSENRAKLHLSAVWTCNFVNHMYYIGEQMASKAEIPLSHLIPLIKETSKKIENLSPKDAQTGPAKRNDTLVVNKHINSIENPIYKDLYREISSSISKTYNHEL